MSFQLLGCYVKMHLQGICNKLFTMINRNIQEEINRRLHDYGLRTTSQRVLVLSILQESNEHLDAEGIWQRARGEDCGLNLATVYRTLKLFEEIGLVQQSYLGDGGKRGYYELLDKPLHYHFECTKCGKVLELESEKFQQAYEDLEHRNRIRICSVSLKFDGLCQECLAVSV